MKHEWKTCREAFEEYVAKHPQTAPAEAHLAPDSQHWHDFRTGWRHCMTAIAKGVSSEDLAK